MGGAYLILVLTLVTTFYAWHLVEQSVVEQDTERFKDEVRRMIEMLRANHRRHLDTLNPLRARLESAPEITTALWRQAVTREPWHAAGSLEVGYAEAQGDGPDLKCPVRFLETKLEGSRRQPGTDLAQETAIRPALRAAAANDHAVATRRVRLTTAGAPDRRLAVLVLLAVRAPEPASTARGFLFLTYDPEELVNDPRLQMASSGVELAIVAPLTPKPGAIAEPEEPFQRRTLFTMPGVSWTLLFTARPSFFLASEKCSRAWCSVRNNPEPAPVPHRLGRNAPPPRRRTRRAAPHGNGRTRTRRARTRGSTCLGTRTGAAQIQFRRDRLA